MSFGWRSIFTINIPLGILAFALVATQMVERASRGDPVDLAGAATLAIGVTALLFAVLHRRGPGPVGLLPGRPPRSSRPSPSPFSSGCRPAASTRSSPPTSSPACRPRRPTSRGSSSARASTASTRSCRSSSRAPAAGRRGRRRRRHAPGPRLGGLGGRGRPVHRPLRLPPDGAPGRDPHPRRLTALGSGPPSTPPSPGSPACGSSAGPRAFLDEPGPRHPARRPGGPARRRHEPRPVLADGRRLDRRRSPGRHARRRPRPAARRPRPSSAAHFLEGGAATSPRPCGSPSRGRSSRSSRPRRPRGPQPARDGAVPGGTDGAG